MKKGDARTKDEYALPSSLAGEAKQKGRPALYTKGIGNRTSVAPSSSLHRRD